MEMVFGGRCAAIENTWPSWFRTKCSTGFPQDRKRGTSVSFIRARVTATTGSSSLQSPAFCGRYSNPFTAP